MLTEMKAMAFFEALPYSVDAVGNGTAFGLACTTRGILKAAFPPRVEQSGIHAGKL